jgi:hypothetical protein
MTEQKENNTKAPLKIIIIIHLLYHFIWRRDGWNMQEMRDAYNSVRNWNVGNLNVGGNIVKWSVTEKKTWTW